MAPVLPVYPSCEGPLVMTFPPASVGLNWPGPLYKLPPPSLHVFVKALSA